MSLVDDYSNTTATASAIQTGGQVTGNVNNAPSFVTNSNGIVTTALVGFPGSYGGLHGRSITIQTDGKIVVAGYADDTGYGDYFALVRYNANGSLDATFSDDGIVTTDIGGSTEGSSFAQGYSVSIQSDGKIVLTGQTSFTGDSDFALARYNSDGNLDTSFGENGIVATTVGPLFDAGRGVTIQPNGKILVVGTVVNGSNNDLALVRYNVDGKPDTTFDSDGVAITALGLSDDVGYSVSVQVDGKILVAGSSNNGSYGDFALVRYNTDGSLDTSFNGSGIVSTAIGPYGDEGRSIAIQTDGKILVAGSTYDPVSREDFALVRYNSDGSLDSLFSDDGIVSVDIGGLFDYGYSVAIQADGKILVAGSIYNYYHSGVEGDWSFALLRFNGDGSLDSTFSEDGIVTTAIGAGSDQGFSVSIQEDGKIVVAGSTYAGVNHFNDNLALVRYNTDGSLDTTFGPQLGSVGGSAIVFVEQSTPVIMASLAEVFDADLNALDNYGGASLSLSRQSGANHQDLFSGAGIMSGQTSGDVSVSATIIGSYTYSTGTLHITFNASATQDLINQAMQSLAYANSSDAPPPQVFFEWNFNDGNTGGQGSGGVISVSGITTISITGTNDAPVLSASTPTLATITENDVNNIGQTAASLFGNSLSDLDANAQQGMALLGVGGSCGLWQYSVDNGNTWSNVGTVADTSALLLRATDLLRWRPDGTQGTTATLTYLGWDQTTGAAGSKTSVVSRGEGTSAYSTGSDTATLNVSSVNDPPSFATGDGKLTTAIGSSNDYCYSVAVLPDGKILLIGTTFIGSNADFALVRYNADGSLDTTFSSNGIVTTAIGLSYDLGNNGTVQPDGKILVAGSAKMGSTDDFALVRYNADGSLDTTFSGDGIVTTAIGWSHDHGYSVKIQTDGKILVAGDTYNGKNFDLALVRYSADGSLDTTFSGDGIITTAIGSNDDYGKSVTIQSDGKIIVAVTTLNGGDFALVRYNADGSQDTTFSDDGIVTTPIGLQADQGYSVVIQSDGKILVAGYTFNGSNYDFALVRYNSDGSLDATFNGDGIVTTAIGSENEYSYSVIVQPDGKILVAGFTFNGSNNDFALIRYTTDGSLDASFSDDGIVTTDIGGSQDSGLSVTIQPDGNILVAGNTYIGNNYDFALVRYNTDGELDTTFDVPTGSIKKASVNYVEQSAAIVMAPKASVVDIELKALNNYDGASMSLLRQDGANPLDLFSGAGVVSGQASGEVTVSATVIGSYAYTAGALSITFNSSSTQNLVNQAMQLLAYANSSDAPSSNVAIEWTFNDGNTGGQGSGGALSTSGITTVNITGVNDSPAGSVTLKGTPKAGQILSAANTLADADGLGTIGYKWQANSVDISGANAATYTLTQADVGKTISAVASYTDAQGTVERVSSAALLVEPSSRLTLTATHWKTGKGALSNVDIGMTQDGTRLKTAADGRISAQGFTDPDSVDDGHTVLKPQLGAIGAQASITLTDVLGALKVYLNKPLDAAYDSPYKYIAADFQGDGDVDLSDVLSLLKYYLKKPVDAAPSWVFVDSAHTVTVGGKSLPVSSTTGQALSKSHAAPADIYVHLDSETPLQLIGVLRGDMDGSSA